MDKQKYLNESDLLREGTCGFYHLTKGVFHYHRQIEIAYVEKGALTVKTGTGELSLVQNQFAVIRPYELHTFYSKKKNKCVCPILPDRYSNRLSQKSMENCILSDPEGEILRLFKLYPQFQYLSPERRMFYFQMIYQVLEEFLTPELQVRAVLSNTIFRYIQENYNRHITVDSVAEACATNRNYVSSLVNRHTHMNFNAYLNRVRLSKFIDGFRPETDNIASAAGTFGFESARTFYRAFRKEYGMTPSEYFTMLHK